MPRSIPTTHRSPPTAVTINPGSGNFFLAQERKNETLIAFQLRNPTIAEKIVGAVKTAGKAVTGGQQPDLGNTVSALAEAVYPQYVTDGQRDTLINEMVKVSHTARSLAKIRAMGPFVVVGAVVVGSLGTAAWVWKTGGREVCMERAKAKATAEVAATPEK